MVDFAFSQLEANVGLTKRNIFLYSYAKMALNLDR